MEGGKATLVLGIYSHLIRIYVDFVFPSDWIGCVVAFSPSNGEATFSKGHGHKDF